jgi:glycosyltransferase involved in cell wall biosynthesis
MITVLHLTISLAPGGRRSAIITLASNLASLGVQCELGCLHDFALSPEELARFPAPVTLFEKHRLVEAKTIEQLAHFCFEHEIKIVHTHDAESQLVGALLKIRNPSLRVLMTFHRSLPRDSQTFRDRARNAFASALCRAIVTGSQERRQHFLEENYVPVRKMRVIPFGIDVDRFRPDDAARAALRRELNLEPDKIVIGTVGHFGDEKGIDTAIRAFQELWRTAPLQSRLALVVVGSGRPAQEAALRELAARQPECQVIFAGFQQNVERWHRAFDVFLHTPRLEAFGLVLIEAMASAIPVGATNVGGIPEIVKPNRTGLLVPFDADVEKTAAEALQRLIEDPPLRLRMGKDGRRVAVADFTAKLSAERHIQLYKELLNG